MSDPFEGDDEQEIRECAAAAMLMARRPDWAAAALHAWISSLYSQLKWGLQHATRRDDADGNPDSASLSFSDVFVWGPTVHAIRAVEAVVGRPDDQPAWLTRVVDEWPEEEE